MEKNREIEAEPIAERVATYALFTKELKPKLDVVYYPGSGSDISPSIAFPASRVIYADLDEKAMGAVKKKGYETHTGSASEFDPGPVDVLIMINSGAPPQVPGTHINENGYVLANNHFSTATYFHTAAGYELRGVVNNVPIENLSIDTKSLEDYWKEIDTEADLESLRSNNPAFHSIISNAVRRVTGASENVLAEYKKLLEQAREELRRENEMKLATDQNAYVPDPQTQDTFIIQDKSGPVILTSLPKKKGTADSIFIFQKMLASSAGESE